LPFGNEDQGDAGGPKEAALLMNVLRDILFIKDFFNP
jgi:hypothetical protein